MDDQPNLLEQDEREVLRKLAGGLSVHEAADVLNISYRTAKRLTFSARVKLNAASNTQAVAEAVRRGFIVLLPIGLAWWVA